jgi:hypothetical protein
VAKTLGAARNPQRSSRSADRHRTCNATVQRCRAAVAHTRSKSAERGRIDQTDSGANATAPPIGNRVLLTGRPPPSGSVDSDLTCVRVDHMRSRSAVSSSRSSTWSYTKVNTLSRKVPRMQNDRTSGSRCGPSSGPRRGTSRGRAVGALRFHGRWRASSGAEASVSSVPRRGVRAPTRRMTCG